MGDTFIIYSLYVELEKPFHSILFFVS